MRVVVFIGATRNLTRVGALAEVELTAPARSAIERDVDVVVIGAGFAGLYALYKLREAGLRVRVFERGEGIGGTWYWNRYPGARVDIQSVEYMFTKFPDLEQEWDWTELMPAQEEIERYLNWVADKLNLRSGITFNTSVESARYDAAERLVASRNRQRRKRGGLFIVAATDASRHRSSPRSLASTTFSATVSTRIGSPRAATISRESGRQ